MSKTTSAAKAAEEFNKFEAESDSARAMEKGLRAQLKLATTENAKLKAQLGILESLEAHKLPSAPQWLTPKSPAKGHRAILSTMLTDTHFDEDVSPDEIDGMNAYNRHIAEIRLERYFKSSVNLAKNYLSGVKYDGAVLMLGGDIFSGNIHEELQRTNADTLFGSLLHWLDPLRAGLELFAREFGRVHVAGTPGNHGRMTRKPIMKQRAADNLDWLTYRLLAREMKNDDRFTWEIPTSADTNVQIYDERYLLTHGDQFRGGSGIAGALSPMMIGAARKTKRQLYAGKPYKYMALGHWHTQMFLPGKGILAGGSLKGVDEYSFINNFEPEPPQQPLWIATPERGITFSAPVICGGRQKDRDEEGW
jgi:hypothetical protein